MIRKNFYGRGMKKRRLCIVTGSRAEYSLLYWLMREIKVDPSLQLQVVVTGTHLSNEFGSTYKAIEDDRFIINEKVEMLVSSDTASGISKSIALGVIGFSNAFEKLKPDVVILLGDRFEIFAAGQAALVHGIPIAHISGGEVTEGAIDDTIRHCLTKMANFHFVSGAPYRNRVIQMGEHPDFVINSGDPGVENIRKIKLLARDELAKIIGLDLQKPYFLVTLHPETVGTSQTESDIKALLQALEKFQDYQLIITQANADRRGSVINRAIEKFALNNKRILYAKSLGQINYLSAMKYCTAVIGNSSSGIVEAPVLEIPTVNIGLRQAGRLMADSIISCKANRDEIINAINNAIACNGKSTKIYYEEKSTSVIIKEFLKTTNLKNITKKFYDISKDGKK